MAKHKHQVPAVTEAARQAGRHIAIAGLAGRRLTALLEQGDKIAAKLNNSHQRSLQAVCSDAPFSALIKQGNTTLQIEGTSFAVTTHD